MTRQQRRNLLKGLAFLSPWLVGFCLFMLGPIVLSAWYSLCEYSMLQEPLYIGLENYRELWADPLFTKSLTNTLVFAAMALPATMLISLGLALLLNVPSRAQSYYRTVIFLPSLVPVVASAIVWLGLFDAKRGLLNQGLELIGLTGPNWLRDPSWAMPALVFMSLWGVGHTVVIYLAGLQDVPTELYEAAEVDGAGWWSRLWNVTLPMISPVIFFNLVMAMIRVLQVFTIPYIMTPQGGPGRSTYFYTMYLYDNAFIYLRMGYASAMAWILLIIILLLTGLAFWSSRRWVHYRSQ
ncbi:MAG: carbohydrate ABC transporter permease [Phycisphaerae bacterium]